MRALRILLAAWAGTLLVVMLIPALRAHLGFGFGALVAHDASFAKPPPAPTNSSDALAQFAFAADRLQKKLDQATESAQLDTNAEPMMHYCEEHPDDPKARAVLVRMLLTTTLPPHSKDPVHGMVLKRAKLLLELSKRSEEREPDNWFWRMGTVVGLMALDQAQAARVALTRQPLPTHYRDDPLYEAEQVDKYCSQQFWGVAGARRMLIYSAVQFPQLSTYGDVRKSLFHGRTEAEKDAWLSLGTAMCRDSSMFIELLVGRSFVLSEVADTQSYNWRTEKKDLLAMLAKMENTREGRPPAMSEIRVVATTEVPRLADPDFDASYALLAYMPMAAALLLLALTPFICTPWRIPNVHWFIPILVSFLGTVAFGASTFNPDRWLLFMTTEAPSGVWSGLETPSILLWPVAAGCVAFQKWRNRRDFQALVVLLLGVLLYGVSMSVLPMSLLLSTIMAQIAIIGQRPDGSLQPWVVAVQLTLLALLFQLAQQSSPPFLTVGIAALALISVSPSRTPAPWTLSFGLVLLFGGLLIGRRLDHRALSWVEADQRLTTEFRAQLEKSRPNRH